MVILILYLISTILVGKMIVNRLFVGLPVLLRYVGMWLIGTVVTVPIVYGFSCLFVKTGQPMFYSTVAALIIFILIGMKYAPRSTNGTRIDLSDIAVLVFSLVFSSWLMTKTFHAGAGGELYVGSNNVFDFGHALGIIRSFSWGLNFPFTSPFMAGLPFFYHFFYYFYVAIWEYFGVPIVYAINIPSIMSFSAFLLIIYYLPQLLFNKGHVVGWIAMVLTITNSTLTFFYLLAEKGLSLSTFHLLWQMPTYPFRGPFDGSVISLFTTLNNFINQRHLSFALAIGFFLYSGAARLLEQRSMNIKKSIVLGIITGCTFFWNVPISVLVVACIALLFMSHHRWKDGIVVTLLYGMIVCIFLIPYVSVMRGVTSFLTMLFTAISIGPTGIPTWTLPQYLWQNLGILPFVIGIGWFGISLKKRIFASPFMIFFISLCAYGGIAHRGFDQKFYSFLIIGMNIIAACGIDWLWERKQYILKIFAGLLLCTITISGVIDLLPVKNEFSYPIVDSKTLPVISWIRSSTPKHSIFVSYADMVDPVVFAGRNNYYGFFGNAGSADRSKEVKNIFAGSRDLVDNLGISYILIPKWQKNDFPYTIDILKLRQQYPVSYEDKQYLIFNVHSSVIQ